MSDSSNPAAGPYAIPVPGYDLWAPALAGAAKWNGRMYEGFATLGSEWLDFVNRRLKEDLSLPPRVCACRSPGELRDAYDAFWHQAIDDYQNEFAVMVKLGSGFLSNSLTAAQTRAEEAAREVRQQLAAAA